MPAERPQPTLADYLAIVLSPALIMVLVSSLVFFLVEVLYVGQYSTRLLWVLFFFVFAAVLIGRMSMTPGIAGRAGLYGLILGLVVFIALQSFVEYMPDSPVHGFNWVINLGLMGVIWWCAHRLTWDCTFIDENVDASGSGILEIMGLEEKSGTGPPAPKEPVIQEEPSLKEKKTSGGLYAWWDRYRAYKEDCGKQPHAPGVWIVYFSVAGLAIFGLGQSLIPAGDGERRQYVFWLMVYFVGSALGLLLTTSFLGLRRYLRQRRLQMPKAMTGAWVIIGGIVIVVLLAAGAFLPRPNAEYPLVTLPTLAGSPDRKASQHAVLRDSPGQGQGRPGKEGTVDREGNAGSGNRQGNPGGQNGNAAGGNSGSQQGNRQGSGSSGSQGNSGSGGTGNSNSGNAGGNANSGQSSGRPGESNDSKPSDAKAPPGGSASGGPKLFKDHNDGADQSNSGTASSSSSPSETSSSFSSLVQKLGTFLKWIVFALVALVLVFFGFRAILRFLANFTGWAKGLLSALQNMWQSLFGWLSPSDGAREPALDRESRPMPRPFASFRNPFSDGTANQYSPEELVRYSFEALEAWAWQQGLGRQADDTPLEFADRIAMETPPLAADCRRLAALYARAAYARGRLPNSCLEAMRKFWQQLENVVQAPLSA